MLTGDKMETAENIARSCNLFSETMEIVVMDSFENEVIKEKIASLKEENNKGESGLLIDGSTLEIVFSDKEMIGGFLSLAIEYNSVVVCRATPK